MELTGGAIMNKFLAVASLHLPVTAKSLETFYAEQVIPDRQFALLLIMAQLALLIVSIFQIIPGLSSRLTWWHSTTQP